MLFFCLFACLLANNVLLGQGQDMCEDGYIWYVYENTCIKVFDTPATRNDAEEHCKNDGGNLVSITDSVKNEFVTANLKSDDYYWIGLLQDSTTGEYYDSNGEIMDYSPFVTGRGPGTYPCVMMLGGLFSPDHRGKWLTVKCVSEIRYVCERPVKGISCDDDSIYYWRDNSCIKIVDEPGPWDVAKSKCEASNSKLLMIDSNIKNEFVTENLNSGKFYWIGVRNQNPHGLDFYNVDGVKTTYTNWRAGQPDNYNYGEHCVMIFGNQVANGLGGQWNDFGCFKNLPFLCERDYESKKISCGDDSIYYGEDNSCIKIVEEPETWDVAKSKCEASNSKLLMIDSNVKNEFVTENLDSDKFFWIGVRNQNPHGLDFYNVDGVKTTFTNWRAGQPDNYNYREHCVMIFGNQVANGLEGQWNDFGCGNKLPYMCERDYE